MNRRNFLQLAFGAVAASAATRVWPFRVYSIPNKIVIPRFALRALPGRIDLLAIEHWFPNERSLFGIPANDPTWGSTVGPYMGLSRAHILADVRRTIEAEANLCNNPRLPSSES